MRKRHTVRGAIGALVACALAALLINTWIVEGLFVPLVVHGGSMSPGLLGGHCTWRCEACGEDFPCNLESLPPPGRAATCPHCGAGNDPTLGVEKSGDRVLVDRSALCWRQPRRWETIVVRSPANPEMLCVKRVVGLPGETVEIADGNILIDGETARKNLDTMRAMAVSVSGPQATDRWQAAGGTWRMDDGWFLHERRRHEATDWLSYHHREHATRGIAQAILDSSALDQDESRLLNRVDDVMLRCEILLRGSPTLQVRATHRGDDFRVELDTARTELRLKHSGRTVHRAAAAGLPQRLAGPAALEFVVADCRVQFALGGRLLLQYDYEPTASPTEGRQMLAVGAKGSEIRVRKLEVLRDVYYTPPPRNQANQYRLGQREYFLLGDNSPHSQDSRDWSPRGGVLAGLLLGPALAW